MLIQEQQSYANMQSTCSLSLGQWERICRERHWKLLYQFDKVVLFLSCLTQCVSLYFMCLFWFHFLFHFNWILLTKIYLRFKKKNLAEKNLRSISLEVLWLWKPSRLGSTVVSLPHTAQFESSASSFLYSIPGRSRSRSTRRSNEKSEYALIMLLTCRKCHNEPCCLA